MVVIFRNRDCEGISRPLLPALSQLTEQNDDEGGRSSREKHVRPIMRGGSADRVRVFSCKVVISYSTVSQQGQGTFTQTQAALLFRLKASA